MISDSKLDQYSFPRIDADILGITIHETDDYNMKAEEYTDFYNNGKNNFCYHYIIDDETVNQLIPNERAVYHTRKNKDYGDRYTIAIAICPSLNNDKFKSAKEKAINLIKQLMEEYDIGKDSIFFHKDFYITSYCPKTLIRQYGNVKRFVIEELED